MALNLEKQLLFYGSYHHSPVNVWIHLTCVPAILLTSILFLTSTGPLYALPSSLSVPHLPPNLGTVVAFGYATLYMLMEPVAGGLAAPLLVGGAAGMNVLAERHGPAAMGWGAAVFVFSWIAQFVGHGVFEGRAPALLDNLVQALFLAPLFVWLELLFMLGYRPELQARIKKGVDREIERFRKEKEAVKVNGKGKGKEKAK